ncbi:MAG: hypothetical protein KKD74_06410 [Bacteroidetes bacterium]|nr:hypothetical protein [Bacteroidota bacterium]
MSIPEQLTPDTVPGTISHGAGVVPSKMNIFAAYWRVSSDQPGYIDPFN